MVFRSMGIRIVDMTFACYTCQTYNFNQKLVFQDLVFSQTVSTYHRSSDRVLFVTCCFSYLFVFMVSNSTLTFDCPLQISSLVFGRVRNSVNYWNLLKCKHFRYLLYPRVSIVCNFPYWNEVLFLLTIVVGWWWWWWCYGRGYALFCQPLLVENLTTTKEMLSLLMIQNWYGYLILVIFTVVGLEACSCDTVVHILGIDFRAFGGDTPMASQVWQKQLDMNFVVMQ